MKVGPEKRRYLAETLARVAEYVMAVAILGQLLEGERGPSIVVLATGFLMYLVCVTMGLWITPEEEKD